MPLQVSLLEETDLEEFVEVDDLAMKNYPFAQAMASELPSGGARKQLIMGEMRKSFKQDHQNAWLKVTDTESGRLIAGAYWRFQLDPDTSEPEKSAATDKEITKDQAAPTEKPLSFMEVTAHRRRVFEEKFIKGQPFASTFLSANTTVLTRLRVRAYQPVRSGHSVLAS